MAVNRDQSGVLKKDDDFKELQIARGGIQHGLLFATVAHGSNSFQTLGTTEIAITLDMAQNANTETQVAIATVFTIRVWDVEGAGRVRVAFRVATGPADDTDDGEAYEWIDTDEDFDWFPESNEARARKLKVGKYLRI
jgi:hypothetical protein